MRHARWSAYFENVMAEVGVTGVKGWRNCAELCADAIVEPSTYALFPDVQPTLDRIHHLGLPIALISNFDPLLGEVLSFLGIQAEFEVVTTSWDCGYYKPDVRIFNAALYRLALRASSVFFVGDSPFSDVGGARAAGMPVALIDRAGRHQDVMAPRLRRLDDLFVLAGLDRRQGLQ
jgi:putative hydrolase of the HAD superfamily